MRRRLAPLPAPSRGTRLGALLVGLALALSPPAEIAAPGVIAAAVVAGAMTAMVPVPAAARSRIRSSGGYSRPSIRTPSTGAPSSSGGYSRSFGFTRRPSIGEPSAGDRAISGRSGAEALQRYRAQQAPPSASAPSGSTGFGSYGGTYRSPPSWAVNRGWSIPAYAYRAPPSFGIWNGLFLWFLLDTLSRPGHAAFFYNHQNDPGYQSWRADAERAAQNDPQLKAKLDALDQKLTAQQGEPRDPNYLPPGTDPEMALASDAARRSAPGGPSMAAIPLVLGCGGLFLFWTWRRRHAERRAAPAGESSTMAMGPMKSAVDMLRHKLSGEGYTPSLFRVGMTLTMDPTPFILAASATKVPVPKVAGANLLASVAAVGTLRNGATLHRLYLDERSFFQIHLDPSGAPDECRFFGLLDEVTPASEQDWAFWLDAQDGMIGWPEFQTKDGKTYERVWAPGSSRIAPRVFTETRSAVSGSTTAKIEAMLYAAPTEAAAPAPQAEYVLVALVEAAGEARIAIHAGIDVNPAALSLA